MVRRYEGRKGGVLFLCMYIINSLYNESGARVMRRGNSWDGVYIGAEGCS